MTGDLVVTGSEEAFGAEIDHLANINAIDVPADNVSVIGLAGDFLPRLAPPTTTVAASQVRAKTPPGNYDTTGLDRRVDQCEAAQLSISTSTATQCDALSADADLADTLTAIPASATRTINHVTVGVVNVIDRDNVQVQPTLLLRAVARPTARSARTTRAAAGPSCAQRFTGF